MARVGEPRKRGVDGYDGRFNRPAILFGYTRMDSSVIAYIPSFSAYGTQDIFKCTRVP